MPATRSELFDRLEQLGIMANTVEHEAVFTVAESARLERDLPGGHTKNLFLKDAKGRLFLVIAQSSTPIDLKSLHRAIGCARLSFGKPELLLEVLGVTAGSVTAFSLINDRDHRVDVVFDARLMQHDSINCHPLVNTATTNIGRDDLLRFIRACGHAPRIMPLTGDAPHEPMSTRASPARHAPEPTLSAPVPHKVAGRDAEITKAAAAIAAIVDPEIPVLTIEDLGILRAVERRNGGIVVTLTPTYTGCPATLAIRLAVESALHEAGLHDARVEIALSPPWTADDITLKGRSKLKDAGIAPPAPGSSRGALFGEAVVACPRCGSTGTSRISEFGSTACKALWRCESCREPFDYFKCH